MAVHARLGWRNISETRRLDRGMAIAAVQAETADVVGMAERDRLLAHHGGAGRIRGPIQLGKGPRQKAYDENCAEYRDSRKRVRTVMKDLGHG